MSPPRKSTSTRSRSNSGTSNTRSATPKLEDVLNQLCDNCGVGVLQVVRWDPEAQHEIGQDLSAENQNPSGGAYEVSCPYCGFRESRSLGQSNGNGEGN